MNAVVKIARLPIAPRPRPKAHVIIRLLGDSHPHGLDPELVPTDRTLDRWAVAQGSDEYLLTWDDCPPRSRPSPLPDDLAIIVDQVICRSQVQSRRFVMRWYLRPGESMTALAKDLGIHRDSVLMRWRSTLWYMRRRLLEAELDV